MKPPASGNHGAGGTDLEAEQRTVHTKLTVSIILPPIGVAR